MQVGQSRNPNDLAASEDAEEVQWQEVRFTLVGSDPRAAVANPVP